jgi:hypothetical protein
LPLDGKADRRWAFSYLHAVILQIRISKAISIFAISRPNTSKPRGGADTVELNPAPFFVHDLLGRFADLDASLMTVSR